MLCMKVDMSIICMVFAFILHHFLIISSSFHLIRSHFSVFCILITLLHQACMCIANLVVFKYFGCFWILKRGEREQRVNIYAQSHLQPTYLIAVQSPTKANHSITTQEKLTAQFYTIAKLEESPHQNHSITTLSPLYHQEAYLLILHSTRQAKNTEEKRS